MFQSKIILVDMDGVLAGYDEGLCVYLRLHHPNVPLIPSEKRANFYIDKDYPEEYRQLVRSIPDQPGFFLSLPPLPSALVGVRQLQEYGHRVYICSSPKSQYRYCVTEKYQWVEKHLGFDWTKRIILIKDKTMVTADYLIDDRPEINGIFNPPPWEHLLFARPYNRHCTDVRRYYWHEILDLFVPHPV